MQLLANTTSPFVRIARVALIEKGLDIEPTVVDPWADDTRLRAANVATRVPTLILDDGTALSECLLIVQWLERTRPAPEWPSLLGSQPGQVAGVLSRAGMAMGPIEASVATIITRKVTAPALFDETPVGLRRRRTMAEGQTRLDAVVPAMLAGKTPAQAAAQAPSLDIITAITFFDYQQLRYAGQAWLPITPALQALAEAFRSRASIAQTVPRVMA
jgi:glutathione S-transferase